MLMNDGFQIGLKLCDWLSSARHEYLVLTNTTLPLERMPSSWMSRSPIVCEGLSMPHSPRWANGKLWVLNAGTGHLGWVDFEKKAFVPLAFVPGFARGLSIIGNVAAVGLS